MYHDSMTSINMTRNRTLQQISLPYRKAQQFPAEREIPCHILFHTLSIAVIVRTTNVFFWIKIEVDFLETSITLPTFIVKHHLCKTKYAQSFNFTFQYIDVLSNSTFTQIYDKRHDFNFLITNFPFLCGNISSLLT